MIGRDRGPARLATTAVMLAALTACTQADAGTTIANTGSFSADYFASSSAGAFLVAGGRAFTVTERGASAQTAPCCNPPSTPRSQDGRPRSLRSGSVSLDGTPWGVLDDGSAINLAGKEHATNPAVRELNGIVTLKRAASGGTPTESVKVQRVVQDRAVSVVGPGALLAATYTTGSTHGHTIDSVVYRVSTSGTSAAVAGRPALGAARPFSGLRADKSAAATEVDLAGVQAMVALDQDAFVLFMMAPTTKENANTPRLQAALIKSGQISRLAIPDLCASDGLVVASRVSDHEVVLNARKGSNGCVSADDRAWVRIDTAKNTFTEVGSGAGFASITGNQLLTATAEAKPSSSMTVLWQDLADQP